MHDAKICPVTPVVPARILLAIPKIMLASSMQVPSGIVK